MKVTLSVTAGPHSGQQFVLEGHDTFLVGRAADAHLKLSGDDRFFSRRHFLLEVNPPRCRVIDLNSRNGVTPNGGRVAAADVNDGDEITVGHTVFKVGITRPPPSDLETADYPAARPAADATVTLPPAAVTIPGYLIGAELGRGGMGVVYRAVRERDGHAVALKTIAPAAGATRRQVDRFVRECQILAQLDHKHIVGYRDVGEADGLVYLAMELVDGPDLAARPPAGGPADIRTAVRIVCQVLGGLAHAHAKGFVHRDIKPANVLVATAGGKKVAKLADFGLARVYESSRVSGLTLQGEIGGTPAYMAPEQVTHYRDVKPAADQYAAAATLYKLLSGKYTHDFPRDIGSQIAHLVTAAPVPVAERRADIPAGLAATVHKALNREPGDRYPDVTAFRTELKRFA